MPLTDYQKQWALQKAGYDPSKYSLDDSGYINPVQEAGSNKQPTISGDSMVPNKPSDIPVSPQYSPVQTFGMSAGQAAPSTIGGGLGGAGGLAAASWLLGPEVGVPASLAFMIGGGLAGSALAKKGQSMVEPEAWTQAVEQAQTENPKAAFAGQLASIPLAGFSPSPSGVLRGVGAGVKILTGMEAIAPEMNAFRNLAFNTALGGAQPSIDYLAGQGPAPTVGGSLESAGIGALFNKPNAIGNRLGFAAHPEASSGIDREALMQALQQQQQGQIPQVEQVNPMPSADTLAAGYGLPVQNRQSIVSGKAATVAQRSDKMAGYKATPEANDIATFEGEGGPVLKETQSPEEVKLEQERQVRVKDFTLAKQELANSELEKSVALINQQIKANRFQAEQSKVSPLYETPQGVQAMPDYTGVTEHDNSVNKQESGDDLAARQLEAKLAGEQQPKYQEESAFPQKTVAPDHLSVKEAIDTMKTKTDDASILPEDANEIHSILSKQVKWDSMPEVGKLIQDKNFDPIDPDLWVKVQDEYNKHINAPKAQQAPKADIAPATGVEQMPTQAAPARQTAPRVKNPALAGDKALESLKGNLPKAFGPDDLKPKTGERISPNSSEGLKQIWQDIDAGNHQAAMNRIEYAYRDANPDARSVLNAQMYVIKQKSGITPSEQFHTDNPRYQETGKAQDIKSKLDKEGVDINNVKEWNNVITKWAKPRFNIEITEDGDIKNSQTGKPVAGQAYLRNALREAFVKINPDKAGIDTLPHELHHVFMDYLERFGSKSDKSFIERAYNKVESTPEFQAAKAENPSIDPNEFLASKGGLEFIDRQLNLSGNNEWKTFWKDYIAHLKDKFTSKASLEDYSRLLNYKMVHDPLHEGSAFNGTGATVTANQNEPKISKIETDIQRFREIQDRMSSIMKDGNFGGDEFHKLWKEVEEIKNRNGGMPPESKRNQDESELKLHKKGEGKTPYPFTLKELTKGKDVINDTFDKSDASVTDSEALGVFKPHDTPEFRRADALIDLGYEGVNVKNQDFSQFKLTKSLLDKSVTKAEESGAKQEGEDFSKAIRSYYPLKDQTQAKYFEPIRKAAEGVSKEGINKVEDTLLQEFRTKQDLSRTLSGKELTLYKAIRRSYNEKQNDQIAANQPVTDYNAKGQPFQRLPQVDPFYHVNRIAPRVAEQLMEGDAATKARLKQEFLNYQTANGISPKGAQDKLNAIISSYDTGKPNMVKFAANRKAEGVGLPDSWLRKGELLKNLNSYYNRVAVDRAWHDTVETNPDVATSMGMKNDPWGKPHVSTAQDISHIPEVRDIAEKITGEPFKKDEAIIKSLNRVASSLMLGPLTNIHIAAGSFANSLQYLHPTELASGLGSALKNLATNWTKVYETGYHKKDFSSIKDLTNTNLTALDKLNSLASSIGNLSGREGMNHFTKSLLQGMGEFVIKNRAIEANNGDKTAINLMKQVDPDWQQGKVYTGAELDKLASNFASYIHGAHDVRTLPGWMLKDTAIQPFFSLASWNIAQTNAWMKHVWTPATKGDFTPIIMSTLGSVLGGYVVKQMREEIADKKSPIPSLTELMKSDKGLEGNIPLVAYNLMAMSSYTGYAGILSTAAKAGQDVMYKNIPQGAAFPLEEVVSNPAHRISQFLSAMYNDESFDYTKAGTKLATDLIRENFQLGRIIENWTADKTDILGENAHYEKNVNDALGDLRRFKMAQGMPYEDQTPSTANPYTDMTLKEFKRTQNMDTAMEDLPKLIDAAFTSANGDIEVLRQQLAKIKQNNYETMPSPTNIPRTFLTYLNFLSDTQGADVASERLSNYLMQEGMNKMKSSMVPKF